MMTVQIDNCHYDWQGDNLSGLAKHRGRPSAIVETKMQLTGQCRLSGQTCSLIDSHFMPKALYRLFANASVDNPNPVVMTEKSSVQTSKQVTTPLLCNQCEAIFSSRGESWVMKHIYRGNYEWRLRNILAPSIG